MGKTRSNKKACFTLRVFETKSEDAYPVDLPHNILYLMGLNHRVIENRNLFLSVKDLDQILKIVKKISVNPLLMAFL